MMEFGVLVFLPNNIATSTFMYWFNFDIQPVSLSSYPVKGI